jgi:hypothetical protein
MEPQLRVDLALVSQGSYGRARDSDAITPSGAAWGASHRSLRVVGVHFDGHAYEAILRDYLDAEAELQRELDRADEVLSRPIPLTKEDNS